MKKIFLLAILLTLLSCNQSSQMGTTDSPIEENSIDTVLVKIENKIDRSSGVGFYSKSFTYCWVADKDTLDFKIGITERLRDSSIELRVFHQNPILFSKTLDRINEGLPLIKQDFNLDNLGSLYFEPPIYYKDLTTELSWNYENQLGRKNVSYEQLNAFLMESWLQKKVGTFLNQFNKSIKGFGIEKFHIIEKEHYKQYIPNSNLSDYPSFSIHGMGLLVMIK